MMVSLNKEESIYADLISCEEEIISFLLVTNPFANQPLIDAMDGLALFVVRTVQPGTDIEHVMLNDIRVQIQRVTPETLESWVVNGDYPNIVHWLVQGDIIVDHGNYLRKLSSQLLEWTPLLREQKLLSEFSRFVCTYLQAKKDIREGRILDAYSNVLSSLHYWAHILIVEQGMHPELTVWEQMLRVNVGVYKLFEELTTSPETLEQRVQLVLLACEFSVLNKMKSSCSLLIRLVESRTEAWAPSELLRHPSLSGLSIDITVLLHKLVKRGYIREVAMPAQLHVNGMKELRYTFTLK